MKRPIQQIGRLAMRHEGTMWNAYYAMTDTMEGALPLGSIAMRFIVNNPKRKNAFMKMMQEAVSDLIKQTTGQNATWPDGVQLAPPHERSGHA